MDATLGRLHAQACIKEPKSFKEKSVRTRAYADAALEEIEKWQREAPEVLQLLLDGGNQGARQLNTDSLQGLREIVQNADDLGATSVRFGTRTFEGQRQLIIAHNGAPVELMHVLPMIYPFFSTKREDARLKGRFGVGLKTLGRLGDELNIHSEPFHFGCRENLAVRVREAQEIPGFYDPVTHDTLLTLNLLPEIDQDFLSQWFCEWLPSDLVFLDSVRSVVMHDLNGSEETRVVTIDEIQPPHFFDLLVGDRSSSTRCSTFEIDGVQWKRFVCEVDVPPGKSRSGKATDETTPIGIALPVSGDTLGRIHVALPTGISTGEIFSVDAQFDPATSREELVNDTWNEWLIGAVAQMQGALAIHLAQEKSPLAWFVVPVLAETDSSSQWVNHLFEHHWALAVNAFAECNCLIGGESGFGLSRVSYCDMNTEGLLNEADHFSVTGASMLPLCLRDSKGRWREVLDVIDVSHQIGLAAVTSKCHSNFSDKPAHWFLELASRCLEMGEDEYLLDASWIPLAHGGQAIATSPENACVWLIPQLSEDEFCRRHDLCVPVHELLNTPAYEHVRTWLSDNANFTLYLNAEHVLQAFARRYAEGAYRATREDLLSIRELFENVQDRNPTELGLDVGQALHIEAFHYEPDETGKIKTIKIFASPQDVYLSASIGDSQDGWPRAAGYTPGLLWTSPGYAETFRATQSRKPSDETDKPLSRKRGARRFLMLLGAALTPRFHRVDTPSTCALHRAQSEASSHFYRSPGRLKNDYVSPDLDRVIADLKANKSNSGRRTGKLKTAPTDHRCVALFRSIVSNWSVVESMITTVAIRDSGRGGRVEVPSTWIARLSYEPWLFNELGVLCKPRDLAIATKITMALYDDPAKFAAGLVDADADSQFARVLGMKVNPPASELVNAIERHRDEDGYTNQADTLKLYRALAGHCPQGPTPPSPEARVGDITISTLRPKFGLSRSRRGLIAPCVTTNPGTDWFPPTGVYSGKDIFHRRRPFVITDRTLAPLWNALNIGAPNLADCIRELEEIALVPHVPGTDAVLIDIYRHMDKVLDKLSAPDRKKLAQLPLLCDGQWVTKRPLYISDYPGLGAKGLLIWTPPCAVDTIKRLVGAMALLPLPIEPVPRPALWITTDELRLRFNTALNILRTDLARDDEASYRAMEPWSKLDQLIIYLHQPNDLIVRAVPTGHKAIEISVQAHTNVNEPALHFDNEHAIGRREYGGLAIAQFANGERSRQIALAWASAWATSADHVPPATIKLATDELDTNLDALIVEHERQNQRGRRKMPVGSINSSTGSAPELRAPHIRRLKELPEEFAFSTSVREGNQDTRKGIQPRGAQPLPTEPPKRSPKRNSIPAPVNSYCQYDSQELQKLAWIYVRAAFDDGLLVVEDYQAVPRLGADGAIDWTTFIEMKSFAREAPAAVSLTESEFLRAQERKENFYLVVVSGLEEGFDTQIRLYINPLNNLPWSLKGSISLGGLGSGSALIFSETDNCGG
jgi:hypothetical protein